MRKPWSQVVFFANTLGRSQIPSKSILTCTEGARGVPANYPPASAFHTLGSITTGGVGGLSKGPSLGADAAVRRPGGCDLGFRDLIRRYTTINTSFWKSTMLESVFTLIQGSLLYSTTQLSWEGSQHVQPTTTSFCGTTFAPQRRTAQDPEGLHCQSWRDSL